MIELLVVISIIGLLVAILLPSLARARKSAVAVQCLANQRQIYLGFPVYAQNFNDYFPTSATQASTGSDAEWHLKLGESGAWGNPSVVEGINHNNISLPKKWWAYTLLRCPGEEGDSAADNIPYWKHENGRTSYATNITMQHRTAVDGYYSHTPRQGWDRGPIGHNENPLTRPSTTKTGEAPIVMDISAMTNRWTIAWFSNVLDSSSASHVKASKYAFRHNGAANLLYWDGHAEAQRHYLESGDRLHRYLYPRMASDAPAPPGQQTAWRWWSVPLP